LVSQIGMLPATIVYSTRARSWQPSNRSRGFFPGADRLARAAGVVSARRKHLVESAKARRRLAKWPKPEKFERNLVVIGGVRRPGGGLHRGPR